MYVFPNNPSFYKIKIAELMEKRELEPDHSKSMEFKNLSPNQTVTILIKILAQFKFPLAFVSISQSIL